MDEQDDLNHTMIDANERHPGEGPSSLPEASDGRFLAIMQQMSSCMASISTRLDVMQSESQQDRVARVALERDMASLRSAQLNVPTAAAPQPAPNESTTTASMFALPNTDPAPNTSSQPAATMSSALPVVNNVQHLPPVLINVDDASFASARAPTVQWSAPSRTLSQAPSSLASKPFQLPDFSGLPEQWPMFHAAFQQSTTEFGYTALQNIFRLQRCLKGDARDAVEFLLISPDNIDELMAVLRFRFGRPEILAQSQMAKMREIPGVTEQRIDQLVPLSTRVQNLVAFLNTDASRHVLTETTLLAELVAKLPPSKQMQWVQHSIAIRPRPTVLEFSTWLKEVAQCVCLMTSQTTQHVPAAASSSRPQPYTQPNKRPARHVLLNAARAHQCSVCSRAHKVIECSQFRAMRVSDRWATCRRERLCFGCLRTGHMFEACHSKRSCPVNNCQHSHHELLHDADSAAPSRNEPRRDVQRTNVVAVNAEASISDGRRVNPFDRNADAAQPVVLTCREGQDDLPPLFRVLPVTLHGPETKLDTYALLDEGSAITMINAETAALLNVRGRSSPLNIQWIGQHSTSEQSQKVKLSINGASQKKFCLSNVRTVHNLNLPMQTVSMPELPEPFRRLPIAEFVNATPQILIGLDNSHLGVARRTWTCGGLIAARTRLGWVVYGSQSSIPTRVLHVGVRDERMDRLEQIIQDYFTTENFGVKRPERVLESDDDTRARTILERTTVRIGARFQTGLLWRTDDVRLPNSYEMACQRLKTVENKMRRDPAYATLYEMQISSFVRKSYARLLTAEEASVHDERTWYLPHFGVQTINKPGKLRIVFDAAATVCGTSLNSALLKGPDLNQPLAKILFQFRMRRIGVCADIAEMFLQIEVRPEDRRSQRFVWRRPGAVGPPDVYEMRVMTFGATCSPTSAQFIKNKNASQHADEFPAAAKAIHELHYVDDFVASFSSEEEAATTTKNVVEIHRRGGFHLRGFVSNSGAVLRALGVEHDDTQTVDMQMDIQANDKILGMRWSTQHDEFLFSMRFDRVDPDVVTGERPPTKREILSTAMSVFDPFGFLANFMLYAKLLIQELWKVGVGWDDPIPTSLYDKWQSWRNEIEKTKRVRIPRCYSESMMTSPNIQLHVFADASEEAFAAVAFWRIAQTGRCELAFVAGKTKCAPTRLLSVPRLELQAAVLAVRLHNTIRECHDVSVSRVVLWTDSRTVLQWIRSHERRYKPFVAHRVAEILDSTRESSWRWVPTKLNVADDATRGLEQPNFDPSSRWLRGPAFLMESESSWPTEADGTAREDEEFPEEIRSRFVGAVNEGSSIDFNRFSSFHKLCRAVAWILRFAGNTRARARGQTRKIGELTVNEVHTATDMLCRIAQRQHFAREYAALADDQQIDRSSPLLTLMPYMDANKLMRLYGRTDAADTQFLDADAQRPIILPRDHRFTELLVRHHHERMGHQFEDGTICAIRRRYWVPKLRPLVRSVKHRCAACKFRAAQPRPPIAGQLPIDRITPHVPAFQYTGLDYFGPVNVAIGRRCEKRWIALFTCLTTRAIHMEISTDLSTDACLMCVRNFCNIRGVPLRIRSDCGTNFVGADNEIRRTEDFIDQTIMQRTLSTKGIEWRFNCPANPEAGGAWERLVQSTKRVLAVILHEKNPQVETLRSLVIEAANMINSRPLTHVPVSPTELEPLTPNHFLLGRVNSTTTAGDNDARQLCSRKQWRIQQQLMRQFWQRWVNEYLPELTRRTKFYEGVGPVKIGDLVLVCDANQSRGQWTRGRVEQVNVGTDGRVRTAEIRTSSGIMRRPVSKLAILDVEVCESREGVRTHGARDVAAQDEAAHV